ncbi:phage protease [Aliiroseovarius crassostreae]|uniref:phage protease n=1 Tax=Aliiroseovarius crassostreae TaxID=154981 RepID=UPI00220118E0|nr:phage protease [Aliiroseovarius crassostreae]UWQ00845.1 phage protease [Aliiroseovarius crassostreae]
MTLTNLAHTTALALNAEGDQVPDWIQLTPAGPNVSGRDGRGWRMPAPEAVVAAFRENGADLPVDFEHATQIKGNKGEAAPAIGWIKDMDVREGQIWARVEWTEAGRNAIASKGYRYVSPVFKFTKAAKTITRMISAGLTNQPNLQMAALNTEGDQEDNAMNKAILEALGLSEGASEADALTAINKMKSDTDTALNRAEHPDSTKFVPRADYELAMNKVKTFEKAEEDREAEAINTAVDAAIEAGKIAPGSRDYHVAACRTEGGLENFQKMVDASPVLAGDSGLDGKDATAQNKTALTEEEQAVCRQMGISAEEFLATKNEDKEA